MRHNLHEVAQLPLSSQRWIVQRLADAAQQGRWVRLEPERISKESGFKLLGAGATERPKGLQVSVSEHRRAMIPPVVAVVGRRDYMNGLSLLTEEERFEFLHWLQPRKDVWGRRISAPALFRSQGSRIIRNEHTNRTTQDSAMIVFGRALVFEKKDTVLPEETRVEQVS